MAIQLERTTLVGAFRQKAKPTNFLSGMFQTPPRNIVSTKTVIFDIQRDDEQYAVDVVRGTGGRRNERERFSTKTYTPPMYDEYASLNAEALMNRLPGQTEYSDMNWVAHVLAKVTDDQVVHQEKILRSIEVQAAEVLQSGTVTLHNNESLDYKMKATHIIAAGDEWSDTTNGDPIANMNTAAAVIRQDGKKEPFAVIMGETAFTNFMAHPKVQAEANLRRVDRITIRPPSMNAEGAAFHGEISLNNYTVQVWTYPQIYKIPTGFGLANEGTFAPYIGAANVIMLGRDLQLDLVYAGIPILTNQVDQRLSQLGLSAIPNVVAADFYPYVKVDTNAECVNAGVKSAPLCIPTQIDGFAVIQTETP